MSDPDPMRRGWRRRWRWWHIAIAVTVVLVVGVSIWAEIMRSLGRSQYDHVIATIKEAGRPTTTADLVVGMPCDGRLQDDWDSWQKRFDQAGLAIVDIPPNEWALWVTGVRAQPPENTRAELGKAERLIDAGRALLHRGPLNINSLAWMARNHPAKPLEAYEASWVHMPNLLSLRYLAEWLHHDALVSGHPDDDLDDLDRLLQDQCRPASLMDAMMMNVVADIRDKTYGELEVMRLLSEKSRMRWFANGPDLSELFSDGFQGERILATGAMADRVSGSIWRFVRSDEYSGIPHALHDWIFGYYECANAADAEDQFALRLHHVAGRAPLVADIRNARAAGIINHVYPNIALIALLSDAGHRMSRVAMSILTLLDSGGTLPNTQAQLQILSDVSRDLNPGGDHFRIEYERPAGDRFRLTLDPSSPVPDFIDAERYAEWAAHTQGPANRYPLTWISSEIEVRVAGRRH
jgi:hypothetical protein